MRERWTSIIHSLTIAAPFVRRMYFRTSPVVGRTVITRVQARSRPQDRVHRARHEQRRRGVGLGQSGVAEEEVAAEQHDGCEEPRPPAQQSLGGEERHADREPPDDGRRHPPDALVDAPRAERPGRQPVGERRLAEPQFPVELRQQPHPPRLPEQLAPVSSTRASCVRCTGGPPIAANRIASDNTHPPSSARPDSHAGAARAGETRFDTTAGAVIRDGNLPADPPPGEWAARGGEVRRE